MKSYAKRKPTGKDNLARPATAQDSAAFGGLPETLNQSSRVQAQLQLDRSLNQRKENDTGMPDGLKSGIEELSGLSLDSVKVHYNSPQPAQLNALAYAQGTDIHVAPGQEQHLPHEAWHVVQQSQGRVQPTTQAQGVDVNDDPGLEREADLMGARATSDRAPVQRRPQAKPAGSSVVQGVFIVDGKAEGNPFAVIQGVQTLQPGFNKKLLQTIVLGLQGKAASEDISEADIFSVYDKVQQELIENIKADRLALEEGNAFMGGEENRARFGRMERMHSGAEPGFENFAKDFAPIFRGMTPKQALAVLEHKTFGGQPPSAEDREPPSEKEAQAQTGENVKNTGHGILEEWSMSPQRGFATGGFMLGAMVRRAKARFPKSGSLAERVGEQGVTGWVDQPLEEVGILEAGREPVGDPFEAAVEALSKLVGQKRYNMADKL
jgi:hypothetical protein